MTEPPNVISFNTGAFVTAPVFSDGAFKHMRLVFFTPEGPTYETKLGAMGVGSMYQNLAHMIQLIGEIPPPVYASESLTLKGALVPSEKTKVHFGQHHDIDVMHAMGVLMVRANIVDHGLISLYSALTGATPQQSLNQYYATTNMKARLDTIRGILSATDLDPHISDGVLSALEDIKRASDRRNDLVHGRWNFRNGAHRVEVFKPNSKNPVTEITVTPKLVMGMAEAYQLASLTLLGAIQGVVRARNPASSTAATPSSTDPSS